MGSRATAAWINLCVLQTCPCSRLCVELICQSFSKVSSTSHYSEQAFFIQALFTQWAPVVHTSLAGVGHLYCSDPASVSALLFLGFVHPFLRQVVAKHPRLNSPPGYLGSLVCHHTWPVSLIIRVASVLCLKNGSKSVWVLQL